MFNLCLIGSGPNCLYVLNSILNLIIVKNQYLKLVIYLFDSMGNFGPGWAHSPFQSKTSMLNRIVGQLGFNPDNFIKNNLNFNIWCKKKFFLTRDLIFLKNNNEFPTRSLYGYSLKEIFNNIIQEIIFKKNYIFLNRKKVCFINKNLLGNYYLFFKNKKLIFNLVFILTGHQEINNHFFLSKQLINIITYINFSYPLFNINQWIRKKILLIGMGLTAIDLILFYTENKNGNFVRFKNKLYYKISFKEPKQIFCISRSGYFTYSRPHNFKEINLLKYEHYGFFFNKKFIDLIRLNLGIKINIFNSISNKFKQLDFNIHIYPFIYLELKLSYYKIIFGFEILTYLIFNMKTIIWNFLYKQNIQNQKLAINYLCNYIDNTIFELIFKLKFNFIYKSKIYFHKILCQLPYKRFISTFFSKNNKMFNLIHQFKFENYLFNFKHIKYPIHNIQFSFKNKPEIKLIKFMESDRYNSEQGSLDNPYKGSCDDIFRDLRQIIIYSIDLGGITPTSYELMLKDFYSIHNRAANGNCIELMEKIESLAISKILNIYDTKSNINIYNNQVFINNKNNFLYKINTIIDAKLHNFCIKQNKNTLFNNLIKSRIGSFWILLDITNIRNSIKSFNLNKNFQMINISDENELIFCLGQPSEGIFFFQNGSIRPFISHHVANDILICFLQVQQLLVNI